jgi:DNA-binding NarL/FixJ family response regulator
MKRPRVLLADDHKLLLEAFQKLLEPDCEVVGKVADGRALLAAASELKPDIIVLDIAMPLLNGLDAGGQIKKMMPDVKLIFLTVNEDPDFVSEAFRIGASGYLLKSSAASELFQAIQDVSRGRAYVTPLVAQGMVDSFIEGPKRRKASDKLTPRQREVLQLLAEGRSMKEAAAILNVTPRTVAFHKYRMMEELRLKTNAELIQFAVKQGLTSS